MIGDLIVHLLLYVCFSTFAVLTFVEWAKTPRITYVKPVRNRRAKLVPFVGMPLCWLVIVGFGLLR